MFSFKRSAATPREGVWRRTMYEYGGSVANAITAALVMVLLGRQLTVEQFGLYQVAMNLTMVILILLNFGLPSCVSRYIAEYALSSDRHHIQRLLKIAALIVLGAGMAGCVVSWLLRRSIAGTLRHEGLIAMLVTIWAWATARMMAQVMESAADALRAQAVKNATSALISLGQLAAVGVVLRYSRDLQWLFCTFAAADAILAWRYWRIVKNQLAQLPSVANAAGSANLLRRALRFSAKEYVSLVLLSLWENRIDLLLVSVMLGAGPSGLFGFAIALISGLSSWLPGTMLRSVSRPLFVEAHLGPQGSATVGHLFHWYLVVTFLLAAPIYLGVLALYRPIVSLIFRPDYAQAVYLVWIFGLGALIREWFNPLRNVLIATERVGQLTFMCLLASTKPFVTWILMRRYGLTGAALSSGLYIPLIAIYLFWWLRRHAGLAFPVRQMVCVALNGAVMLGSVALVAPAVHSFSGLGGAILVGAATYGLATWLNPPFQIHAHGAWPRMKAIFQAVRAADAGRPTVHSPLLAEPCVTAYSR